ncbi:MAG: pirin family protein [Planctomycetes bacterium]|nr:pirin family protein [Planctomycetota bacterium]MCB9887448.1 pirin family protein [Planctomycetota bacterium]
MITIRRADERGSFDFGWLQTAHTFSFGEYYDPAHTHFRTLRVINEDVVAPAKGFGMHPHRDMEILTWILDGSLQHEDSMGHKAVIRPGEVQIMSAGTGVLHSEVNPDPAKPVHLLQIWLFPDRKNLPPRYDQKSLDRAAMRGRLALLAAPPGEGGVVDIHQDARILATELTPGQSVQHELGAGRGAWVQVARGAILIDGHELQAGDGAQITDTAAIELTGAGDGAAEVILFDVA